METRTLVMNIKREFFAAILSNPRRKTIEYRDLTPYWIGRLERVGSVPFNLRLLNGMLPPVPEATVKVERVVFDRKNGIIEFHLGRVVEVKHWDRRAEEPA
jgi:hypothetical protein